MHIIFRNVGVWIVNYLHCLSLIIVISPDIVFNMQYYWINILCNNTMTYAKITANCQVGQTIAHNSQ